MQIYKTKGVEVKRILMLAGMLAAGPLFSATTDEPDYYVEYIESDNGQQWIDTDFRPTLHTRVEMDFQLTATTGQSTPYGVEFGSGLWYCLYLNGTPAWAIDFIHDGAKNSKGRYTQVGLPGDADARFTVVHDGPGGIFAITNVASSVGLTYNMSGFYTVDGDKCDYNLPLFARIFSEATVSAPGRNAKMKLFSCDIYEKGEPVRQFRPAVKDGVAGLWDKQNEKFYASKTARAFIAGKKISGLVILLK